MKAGVSGVEVCAYGLTCVRNYRCRRKTNRSPDCSVATTEITRLEARIPIQEHVNWIDTCTVREPLLRSSRIKKLDVKPLGLSTGNRVSHAVLLREDLPTSRSSGGIKQFKDISMWITIPLLGAVLSPVR